MKKFIVWTIGLVFCLSTSLVFAQQPSPGGTGETKSGIPGGVAHPEKSREEIKAEKEAKKKKTVKKKKEAIPVQGETKSGIPGGVAHPEKSAGENK
jgi:hypothetical protein